MTKKERRITLLKICKGLQGGKELKEIKRKWLWYKKQADFLRKFGKGVCCETTNPREECDLSSGVRILRQTIVATATVVTVSLLGRY